MMTVAADPIAETYEGVKYLITKIVSGFVKRYGGDYDEMFAEANIVFLNVCREYDPERGAFSTLLWHSITNRLISIRKKRRMLSLDAPTADGGSYADSVADDEMPAFDLVELRQLVSNDGAVVLRLIFNDSLADDPRLQKGVRGWRQALRDYLFNQMGWTKRQIRETFEEIRDALGAM